MTNTPNIHALADTPDLAAMKGELNGAITAAFDYYDRMERALDTREAWWAGQTADGRKHGDESTPPFPWEGAADCRVRLADLVCGERVDLLLLTLARMTVQVVPTQARDADFGQRMAGLLRWYLHNEMADEADGEIELLANYQETYGSAVLAVGWWQQLGFEQKTVTLDDVAKAALSSGGPQMLAQVGAMLFEPMHEEKMIELITTLTPLMSRSDARRVLDDLRTKAEGVLTVPTVQASRPCLTALACMQDVIFPVNTWRLQKARFIGQREFLTEPELLEKAEGRERWDEDFVKAALEKKGETFNTSLAAMGLWERQRELGGAWSTRADEAEDLIEVWHFFHVVTHRGHPTLYRTVLHPGCPDYYGAHEAFDDARGEYPHVEFVRERRARSILASRGWPELLDTDQGEVKVQRDARIDRASMNTLPPILEKLRVGQQQRAFGPGVSIPVKAKDDVSVMNMGAPDPTSIEVERTVLRSVNELVGRPGEGVDPSLIQGKAQAAVARWLKRWQIAGTKILQLAQRYTPPMVIGQVTGYIPKPFEISREAIKGGFRLMLHFDARFANADFVFGFMERLEKYVIPLDTNAVVNRDAVIRWLFASIDPTLADVCVRDSESAQQSEIEDELHNIALMVAGVPPPMKLKGQNHAARLQVLQKAFQGNQPFYAQMLQALPGFAQIVDQRVAFLEQQVKQGQNRTIGIYGTNPSGSSPGMAGAAGMGAFPPAGGAA
jgi:hypothetical protein